MPRRRSFGDSKIEIQTYKNHMRKIVLLLLAGCLPWIAAAAEGKKSAPAPGATVDQRVELLSVVFRLAGAREYSSEKAKDYTNDIKTWFEPYEKDTLVRYAQRLRSERGVGYDAVASIAVHLEGKGGRYRLGKDALASLCRDGRWNAESAGHFVRLLNDFYKKTRFDRFFREHRDWYRLLVESFDRQVSFDRSWYPAFYGEESDSGYRIILGCSNGGSNYGPSVIAARGDKTAYAILGCWAFDPQGKPDFSNHSGTVVHEFNHSFVNHLLEKDGNAARLKEAGETILEAVREEMARQAYSFWKAVINESLVRAAEVSYARDHGREEEAARILARNRGRAFLWIDGLDSLLAEYASCRGQYPTLRSFYPRIIEFFEGVSRRIDTVKADYLSRGPRVAAVLPDVNGRSDVDPALKEITIVFDRPIATRSGAAGLMGIEGLEHPSRGRKDAGDEQTQELTDRLVYTLELQPDTQYGFTVIGFAPATADGYMLQPFRVEFRTRK